MFAEINLKSVSVLNLSILFKLSMKGKIWFLNLFMLLLCLEQRSFARLWIYHVLYLDHYNTVISQICDATEAIKNLVIKKAGEIEKQLTNEKCEKSNGLSVSSDGSWRKRGFSFLHSVVTIIGYYSKKVLDIDKISVLQRMHSVKKKLIYRLTKFGSKNMKANAMLITQAQQVKWNPMLCLKFFKELRNYIA